MKKMMVIEVVYPTTSVSQNATVYSNSIKFGSCVGYAGAVLVSTAGSITVTQQCSLNDRDWYDPVDENNAAQGQVAATMTVSTRYIQFNPVLAPYIRFKIVEGNVAATSVTLTLFFQEEG